MKTEKIFCIGWHKTGTTTMGDALLVLGFDVMGARLDLAELLLQGKKNEVLDCARDYSVLQDVPWNALFKELDATYPGSKFILTIRDEQQWLNSALKHFKDSYTSMREWLYGEGIIQGNEELYLKRFQSHNAEVKDYFKDRPEDLLVMDLSKGHGWAELCGFLNMDIPNKAFPHSNKGKHTLTKQDKFILFLKDLIPVGIRKLRMTFLGILGKDPRQRFNNRTENEQARSKSKGSK